MALIKINTEEYVNGRLSVNREKTQEGLIINYGVLEMHPYIENIHTVETERYLLTNVSVHKESFGSNDYNIVYSFEAGDLIIKDDYIPDEVKLAIEFKLYESEEREFFHSINFQSGLMAYEDIYGPIEENED